MADTSIPVQPATVQGATAPAPLPLAMVAVPSGASMVLQQIVTLADDQGDTFVPMTEQTGKQILGVLVRIHNLLANANGALRIDDSFGQSDG